MLNMYPDLMFAEVYKNPELSMEPEDFTVGPLSGCRSMLLIGVKAIRVLYRGVPMHFRCLG
jgi:hypothetical protein